MKSGVNQMIQLKSIGTKLYSKEHILESVNQKF